MQPEGLQEKQDELMNLMTIMYTTLQEILNDRAGMAAVQEKLRKFWQTYLIIDQTSANHMPLQSRSIPMWQNMCCQWLPE